MFCLLCCVLRLVCVFCREPSCSVFAAFVIVFLVLGVVVRRPPWRPPFPAGPGARGGPARGPALGGPARGPAPRAFRPAPCRGAWHGWHSTVGNHSFSHKDLSVAVFALRRLVSVYSPLSIASNCSQSGTSSSLPPVSRAAAISPSLVCVILVRLPSGVDSTKNLSATTLGTPDPPPGWPTFTKRNPSFTSASCVARACERRVALPSPGAPRRIC